MSDDVKTKVKKIVADHLGIEEEKVTKKNIMLILSSPSGVGKTTLTKKIQQKYQNFKISVSHTTRKPRSNEVNGIDYFFVKEKEFKKLIDQDKFYEYAKIYNNYYGTLKEKVNSIIKKNDIIFDIDWQGTQQLSKHKELELIKIYLITKSQDEIKERLINRNQNSQEEIEQRFSSYAENVKHWSDYDYIIINDNLDVCFKQIESVILEQKNKKNYPLS